MKKILFSIIMSLCLTSSVYAQSSASVIGLGENISSAGKTRTELGIEQYNMLSQRNNRYSFNHAKEFFPHKSIDTAGTPVYSLGTGKPQLNMNEINFDFEDPVIHRVFRKTVADMLHQTRTDSFSS